jgi:hypothetical protein
MRQDKIALLLARGSCELATNKCPVPAWPNQSLLTSSLSIEWFLCPSLCFHEGHVEVVALLLEVVQILKHEMREISLSLSPLCMPLWSCEGGFETGANLYSKDRVRLILHSS